jgi:phage gp16-like protein
MAFNQASHDRLLKREAKYAEQDDAAAKKLRTLIHVGKSDLQLDDGTYRVLLSEVAGRPVESSKELKRRELESVLERMKQSGFKVRHKRTGGGKSRPLSQDKTAGKIRAIWLELHGLGIARDRNESALCSWASNSRSENVTTDMSLMDGDGLASTLERLKQWRLRMLQKGQLFCPQCGHTFRPTKKQASAWPKIACDAHEPPVAYQWRKGENDEPTG